MRDGQDIRHAEMASGRILATGMAGLEVTTAGHLTGRPDLDRLTPKTQTSQQEQNQPDPNFGTRPLHQRQFLTLVGNCRFTIRILCRDGSERIRLKRREALRDYSLG
jgi:hypothetical protein